MSNFESEREGLVTSKREIMYRYVKTWFLVDFLAAI